MKKHIIYVFVLVLTSFLATSFPVFSNNVYPSWKNIQEYISRYTSKVENITQDFSQDKMRKMIEKVDIYKEKINNIRKKEQIIAIKKILVNILQSREEIIDNHLDVSYLGKWNIWRNKSINSDIQKKEDLEDGDNFDNQYEKKSIAWIYVLDSHYGVYRDGYIRDYDFVEGYAWRYSWKDIETSEGVYDFEAFDHIVWKLADKWLKLSWLVMAEFPEYLLEKDSIETWDNSGNMTPIPWDENFLEAYRNFITAVSEHQIVDPNNGNKKVAFKDHSVLSVIHPSLPGMPRWALRDSAVRIRNIPWYRRSHIEKIVRDTIENYSTSFPNHNQLYSFWTINDNERSDKSLWEYILGVIKEYPHVGVWQDNLAGRRECGDCDSIGTPVPSFAKPIAQAYEQWMMTGFQMLTSWYRPFNPSHVNKVEWGSPDDGLKWWYDTYGAKYIELYANDADQVEWQDDLRKWSEIFKKDGN